MPPGVSTDLSITALRVQGAVGRGVARVQYAWRRSLHLRVVLTTLVLSALVVSVLGYVLMSRLTTGLLEAKQRSAVDEARAGIVEFQGKLTAADQSIQAPNLLYQLTNQFATRGGPTQRFEVVTLPTPGASNQTNSVGWQSNNVEASSVPPDLRKVVAGGTGMAFEYSTIRYLTGVTTPGLVVGGPLTLRGDEYELYYLFPLDEEADTLSLLQRALTIAGLVLVLLLAAIAWLVTRQVVDPVREAARTAERFSAGRLEERMAVVGEDDLARLARSFNHMAGSLQAQIRQLEDLSRVQRRFVSDVSHELRTPLTTVRMAADVLHEARAEFDPATARSAELLQTQLDRFEALLSDLLEISRFDAGAAVLDADTVDVRDLVRRVVDAADPLAERRQTEVRIQVPTTPCTVECDSRRVERVLRNLVVNAIEHGEGRPVDVRVVADADAVAVGVRDHGVGLRPGESALVFNRFWRADPARARTTGGTGLGLAIALEDARLHGGWLEAWGQPGDGAQFRLTLPRRAGAELVSSPLDLEPADARADRRVPLTVGARTRNRDA
jgi:two-component system sensor histidine kinase MtrB